MIEVLLLLVGLLLVAACGAFVAAEFALVTVDRPTVEREAQRGDRAAKGVLDALGSLSTQLSGAQVGITVTNLAIGFLAEPAVASLIDGPLASIGVPDGAVTGVALTLALVLATAVTMVFGELVPKNLAIARPLATARAVQRFQRGFTTATGPATRALNGTANAILRRFGIEPQEELASARDPEELSSLSRRSAEQGMLPAATAALFERSIAFGRRRTSDVLTPRRRMARLRAGDPVQQVVDSARRSGFSRFPVFDDDLDEVAGLVHVKHAVGVEPARRRSVLIREVMVPPVFVSAAMELDALLDVLREGGLQMAVVIDEFGDVDGLVTLEDLVEELVGEVVDEHDQEDTRVRRTGPGSWSLSGLLRPDEASAATGVRLPEDGGYETVAGLLTDRLGRLPVPGDRVTLDGVRLEVEQMDGLRVDRLRLATDPHRILGAFRMNGRQR